MCPLIEVADHWNPRSTIFQGPFDLWRFVVQKEPQRNKYYCLIKFAGMFRWWLYRRPWCGHIPPRPPLSAPGQRHPNILANYSRGILITIAGSASGKTANSNRLYVQRFLSPVSGPELHWLFYNLSTWSTTRIRAFKSRNFQSIRLVWNFARICQSNVVSSLGRK